MGSSTINRVEILEEISDCLPGASDLQACASRPDGRNCAEDLRFAILDPLREFMGRSSKQIRANIVMAALDMACAGTPPSAEQRKLAGCLAKVVEALHAGSLIIDDIQDVSETRRGLPALHVQIGAPLAINAANWLYFWPAALIRRQNLPAGIEVEIYRLYHDTMIRAHYGQALDLGFDMTKLTRERARTISLAAIEMKTGALMAMCTEFGAIAAGADVEIRSRLAGFGQTFGTVLQMFNDIGELRVAPAGATPSQPFSRPSWVWAVAADAMSDVEYAEFCELMSGSGDPEGHKPLAAHPVVDEATRRAHAEMRQCLAGVSGLASDSPPAFVQEIARKVMEAYA